MDPQAGRRAVLVLENLGAAQDERLPRVIGRHFHAAGFESLFDGVEDFVIED